MKKYIFLAFIALIFLPKTGLASSLSLSPSSGVFSVGSTFNVSVLLDTEGKSINALDVSLLFPTDKLQVVSPSVGQSIVDLWTVPPRFNNLRGTIELEGGIPGGIIVTRGVLTTITFRVKSVGDAIIRFQDKSEVYLNDGLATADLHETKNAVFNLKLPAPQGPIVTSQTHPDQNLWYTNENAILTFAPERFTISGFSYVLSDEPVTLPDNISEGTQQSVTYSNLSDGVHYFHIKSLRDGVWGGVTHFAVKVDTTPPALFPIEILPGARTSSTRPTIEFSTTDAHSGLDHYEIKTEPLSPGGTGADKEEGNFFIETTSPYVVSSPLALGSYDVVVRAHDKAGNFREISKRMVITTPFFRFIGERGILIKNSIVFSWAAVAIVGIILLLLLLALLERVRNWRRTISRTHSEKKLPGDIQKELDELKKYREKYGKIMATLFLAFSLLSFGSAALAQRDELPPPLITAVSREISNEEIFYVGGKTDLPNQDVVIYFQNLFTGETQSFSLRSDSGGSWFYRHNDFLPPGEYLLWAQSLRGEELSPPSPQERMSVARSAITFGASRLSYEAVYLFSVILLLLTLIILSVIIIYHYYHGRKRMLIFRKEIKEAEESIGRGFAVLKRDIEAELSVLKRARLSQSLSQEGREREAQLLSDLETIGQKIGKEIWEIEKDYVA